MTQEYAEQTRLNSNGTLRWLISLFYFPSKPAPVINLDSGPFTIGDHVKAFANSEGAVLLDLKRDRCYSLEPVGSLAFQLLRDGKIMREICAAVAQECQVPQDEIVDDLEQVVSQLCGAGLVVLKNVVRA